MMVLVHSIWGHGIRRGPRQRGGVNSCLEGGAVRENIWAWEGARGGGVNSHNAARSPGQENNSRPGKSLQAWKIISGFEKNSGLGEKIQAWDNNSRSGK